MVFMQKQAELAWLLLPSVAGTDGSKQGSKGFLCSVPLL